MPKKQINALITDLHERYADDLTSPQQIELMNQLKSHMHDIDELEPEDPSFRDTVELFLAEVEDDHPNAAQIVRQVLDVLKNIGV